MHFFFFFRGRETLSFSRFLEGSDIFQKENIGKKELPEKAQLGILKLLRSQKRPRWIIGVCVNEFQA